MGGCALTSVKINHLQILMWRQHHVCSVNQFPTALHWSWFQFALYTIFLSQTLTFMLITPTGVVSAITAWFMSSSGVPSQTFKYPSKCTCWKNIQCHGQREYTQDLVFWESQELSVHPCRRFNSLQQKYQQVHDPVTQLTLVIKSTSCQQLHKMLQ